MKAIGIIAEYNPFHNGHLYQINEIRARTGADFVIAAMSGDFVQRGEPAVFDKFTRAHMALASGVDLVLELPVSFATASAEDFAMAGVSLFDRLGAVDGLCFGSECGELPPLEKAAEVLANEPKKFQLILRERLRSGNSYAKARSEALLRCLGESPDINRCSPITADSNNPSAAYGSNLPYEDGSNLPDTDTASLPALLKMPNNILAIEYLKAIRRLSSSLIPYTIKRRGAAYHEEEIKRTDSPRPDHALSNAIPLPGFASACALRRYIRETAGTAMQAEPLSGHLPAPALQALIKEGALLTPVFADDLSDILNYRLLSIQHEDGAFTDYEGVSPELAARLEYNLLNFSSFTETALRLKSRQYAYTRISRALLHILLGIRSEDVRRQKEQGFVRYARVLGFREDAAPLLGKIKRRSQIPLITKTARAASILDGDALKTFKQDIYASHLFQSLIRAKGRRMKNEYTRSVIKV